jgi:hypothetical protein
MNYSNREICRLDHKTRDTLHIFVNCYVVKAIWTKLNPVGRPAGHLFYYNISSTFIHDVHFTCPTCHSDPISLHLTHGETSLVA